MVARMRRTAIDSWAVPWVGAAAAVVLVVALAWLTTEEPSLATIAASGDSSAPAPTTEPARPFSGVPALESMLLGLEAGTTVTPIPPGQEGVGARTIESLAAAANAAGQSGDDARAGLEAAGFRGGVAKGWVDHAARTVLLVSLDEFGSVEGATAWAAGLGPGIQRATAATVLGTGVSDATAYRFDSPSANGVIHQVAYVLRRGRRVVVLKLLGPGELDLAAAEGHAKAQADRLDAAAP
jgi:hypothetical protein